MPLVPGDDAPEVVAPNQNDETVRVDGDNPTVVYFYPKDETPGCTTEARQFQTELESYRDAGVTVCGVSTDTAEDHRAFCAAEGLDFDLLADPDGEVADAFDVDRRASGVTERTTFVLADGEVYAAYENVEPGRARSRGARRPAFRRPRDALTDGSGTPTRLLSDYRPRFEGTGRPWRALSERRPDRRTVHSTPARRSVVPARTNRTPASRNSDSPTRNVGSVSARAERQE